MKQLLLALVLIGAHWTAIAQDRHLHTYSMRRALPEQVLPALEPQLSADSSIRAFQNQLILNVTDAEYSAALELLEQLDIAARSLLISVRKVDTGSANSTQYGVDGRIGSGSIQVRSGDSWSTRSTSSDVQLRAIDSRRLDNRDNSQQVRAVEGMPAFIAVGGSYPVTTHVGPYGSTRELVPVASGFYATARVIGNEAVVDIDQRDDRVQGRRVATQGIQTQVRGPVGEWIPLGAIDSNDADEEHHVSGASSSNRSSSGAVAIRVELAP